MTKFVRKMDIFANQLTTRVTQNKLCTRL